MIPNHIFFVSYVYVLFKKIIQHGVHSTLCFFLKNFSKLCQISGELPSCHLAVRCTNTTDTEEMPHTDQHTLWRKQIKHTGQFILHQRINIPSIYLYIYLSLNYLTQHEGKGPSSLKSCIILFWKPIHQHQSSRISFKRGTKGNKAQGPQGLLPGGGGG